jgi:glycosyltransferase involved in cell wall biosynthesis
MSDQVAPHRPDPRRLRVTVVNPGVPQLDQLAGMLASRGQLSRLIHPYIRTGTRLERALEAAPIVGHHVRRELGRRALVDIDPALLRLVGTGSDMARALLSRGPFTRSDTARLLAWRFMWRTNMRLSKEAAAAIPYSDVLVAPYGVAHAAFLSRDVPTLKVLDYPIAHHEYARWLLAEEARLRPDMAATLQFNRWPRWVTDRWDQECAAADLILVGSAFVKDSFVAEGFPPSKLGVCPYGVDVALFSPHGTPPEVFRALFVGQIGQRKGIGYLLDAWALARKRNISPRSELVLVGSLVGDASSVLALRDLFRYVPAVPRPALPSIYRSGSVLVLPSLIEGMPLVVLEAMACGLPVLVTPAAAGDIVRDGIEGYVVPFRDPGAIADRLMTLSADPDLRSRMGVAARRRALEYTWDAYGDCVLNEISVRMHDQ